VRCYEEIEKLEAKAPLIVPIYPTNIVEDFKKKIAIGIMTIKVDYLDEKLRQQALIKGAQVFITDKHNVIAAAIDSRMIGRKFDISILTPTNKNNKEIIRFYNNQRVYVNSSDIQGMGWRVISIIPVMQ
jgi:hypothetical protein